MTIKNVLASLPVKDLTAATDWYVRILGREPDTRPMPELVEWKFEGGGWLQVYQGPERAGGGSVTLAVDDMDQTLADLKALNVDLGAQNHSEAIRTVMIKDPDGNSLAFAWSAEGAGYAR
jgi:catechol 2,3-dioxygenase-like lactoylglutathione lyase family enzyme